MPVNKGLKKVLVIGSGPIVIGQAAEFDYAGTQACQTLKKEGIEVILINSNPATIMTDAEMADKVYLEPLTVDTVAKIIQKEKPQGLLATLGGQVGLNIARELAESSILEKENVQLLGTNVEAIKKAEDRELFKNLMTELQEGIPASSIVHSVEEAQEFANSIGYPIIVRPAYTLGGTGGGFANDDDELKEIATKGLKHSAIKQLLIEQSVAGWKEIEYEVIRDSNDNCITVCNMENIDPVGIHTGDSIVVAPSQTLSDCEHQMLRSASLKIIRALGIEGGCNIQFALNPQSLEYIVIEVNPRVSRSSALASKATGYPIAKVATKIALGYTLDEIDNEVTGKTKACFEPSLDYVVAKIPRWPFDKFSGAHRKLGSQMKATGEIMSIGRSIESALLKGIRSLELDMDIFSKDIEELSDETLLEKILEADDQRLWYIFEALRRGMAIDFIHQQTKIDKFFLSKFSNIVQILIQLGNGQFEQELIKKAKLIGLSDETIAMQTGKTEVDIRRLRIEMGTQPAYKMVDTCAGEFEAATPYYYSGYGEIDEINIPEGRKVVVLGSGPIRIGQGIEFDYCCVHGAWSLKENGIQAVVINNNPETVSTDFDTSDRLYFEPLTTEEVLNILEKEKPEGVIVQFGGQTAINLAKPLSDAGVNILGTSVEDIDRAEDRDKFDALLNSLNIPRPLGKIAYTVDEAEYIAQTMGFPVLVRPSYVLGGRAMEIVYTIDELRQYLATAVKISKKHPILVDRYLAGGKELEVDAICDGQEVLIPGIMEHVEKAGVHSGDSTAIYPAAIEKSLEEKIVEFTTKIAKALNTKGLLNIQYVLYQDQLYVIEVNPRSSRTVPYLSKITGIPMVKLATSIMLGNTLKEQGWSGGLAQKAPLVAVKMPVFSFGKLIKVDTGLGPEMKSTGEVLGLGSNLVEAMYKALSGAGYNLPAKGRVLVTIADKDKAEAMPILKGLCDIGYQLIATSGTAKALKAVGIEAETVNKISEGSPHVLDVIKQGQVDLVINTLTRGKEPLRDGFQIRRAAAEFNVPCLTSLDTVKAVTRVLRWLKGSGETGVKALQEYLLNS